jgi:hypothetical protein
MLAWLEQLETSHLRARLDEISIDQPTFITGLARSGTTVLLELLADTHGVATHRYRDFPFLRTPYLWNCYLDLLHIKQKPVERAHRDRIRITPESPEAFEEPIWQSYFPHVHADDSIHIVEGDASNEPFEHAFHNHLKKILLIRGGKRYVSKGNYNLSRIEYLLGLFPDARFVIPVRHPVTHVASLVRTHRLFSDYATADARVPKYLAAAGHYEFGPHRVPIRLTRDLGDRVVDAWQQRLDVKGYAIQWAEIYRYVEAVKSRGDQVGASILVVRYEDFCDNPNAWFREILEHARFDPEIADAAKGLEQISSPSRQDAGLSNEEVQCVWHETEEIAARFGYQP